MSPRRDWPAVVAGSIRCASGVSFLIAPQAANRLWGGEADETPTAQLLLRSMGYRDALVGGMLLRAGWTGSPTTPGWFLASGVGLPKAAPPWGSAAPSAPAADSPPEA
jgi:hypothetical protein